MIHRDLQEEIVIKAVGIVLVPADDGLPGIEGAAAQAAEVEEVGVPLLQLPLRGKGEFPQVHVDEHLAPPADGDSGLEPVQLRKVPLPVFQLGGDARHRVLVRQFIVGREPGAAILADVAVRQLPVAEKAALRPAE